MRTTVDLDERLIGQAMGLSKSRTKKEVLHRSLEALIREQRINRLIGRLGHFSLSLTPRALKKLRRDV